MFGRSERGFAGVARDAPDPSRRGRKARCGTCLRRPWHARGGLLRWGEEAGRRGVSGVIAGNAFLASASGGYFLARMRRTRDAPGSRGDARPPYRRRRGRTRDARNVRASENEKGARTGGPSNGDTRLQSCPGKGQSVDFGRSRESCGTEHRSSREMWSTSRDDKLQPKSGERVWRSRRRAGQVPSSANAMPSRRKYPSKRRSFERTEAIFVTDAHTKREVKK